MQKHLPLEVYAQAMGGTATSGTPDSYYEYKQIMWVEWKWSSAMRPRLIPELEPLQQRWLERAYKNGHKVAVICGSSILGYVFPGLSWESRRIDDAALSGSKEEMAEWIYKQVRRKR